MTGEIPMFFTPPNLSDEEAYNFMEFLQDFILALESHYMDQLRRYAHSIEHKRVNVDESYPF
jgi:hypothetical protein